MALDSELQGRYVSSFESDYDFNDKTTGQRVTGVTRKVFVLAADGEVEVVKFSDQRLAEFRHVATSYKFGDPVSLRVSPGQGAKPHLFRSLVEVVAATGKAS